MDMTDGRPGPEEALRPPPRCLRAGLRQPSPCLGPPPVCQSWSTGPPAGSGRRPVLGLSTPPPPPPGPHLTPRGPCPLRALSVHAHRPFYAPLSRSAATRPSRRARCCARCTWTSRTCARRSSRARQAQAPEGGGAGGQKGKGLSVCLCVGGGGEGAGGARAGGRAGRRGLAGNGFFPRRPGRPGRGGEDRQGVGRGSGASGARLHGQAERRGRGDILYA